MRREERAIDQRPVVLTLFKLDPATRGLRLANARGANAPCVSDMAMALLLAAALRLLPADRLVHDGGWDRVPPSNWERTPGFGGRRLGILGLGEIGRRIA